MTFARTEEQTIYRDIVAAYLRDSYTDSLRRMRTAQTLPSCDPHWTAFAQDLGLLGLGLPVEAGGLGGDAIDHAVLMECFGAALVIEPYIQTAVIGGGILKGGVFSGAGKLLSKIVAGQAILTLAHSERAARYNLAHVETQARKANGGYVISGEKAVILAAPWATHLIVSARTDGAHADPAGVALFIIDANTPGVERCDYKTISGAPASDIRLTNVQAPKETLAAKPGDALPLLEAVIDEATAVVCAEATGIMERLIADTVEYVKHRKQFGQTLSSFQALRHRMADMVIAKEQSAAITLRALDALTEAPVERGKAVSAAKAFVGKSLRFIAQQAVQLHGGVGTTDELAVGAFFKRAVEIERQFGTVDHHVSRYTRLAHGSIKQTPFSEVGAS